MENKFDLSLLDGLYRKNTILISCLSIGTAVVCADTLKKALFIAFAFSTITFMSVAIASFISRNVVYALRIILYTIISSVVYIIVSLFSQHFFAEQVLGVGVYFPLMISNSLITTQTERHFYKKTKAKMLISLAFYIIGYDIAVIIFGAIREILTYGTIMNNVVGMNVTFSALSYSFGGFILLGLLSAIYRKIVFTIDGFKK